MLLGANLVIARISGGYFDLDAESNALLKTWSLSVEEQFYLVFPALLMLGFAIARRVRYARWVPGSLVLGVGAVSFFAALLEASGYVLPRESWLLGLYFEMEVIPRAHQVDSRRKDVRPEVACRLAAE